MITVSDVSVGFSGQDLFSHVNLLFTPGNCYGVIGANGAGKSTFLKVLSGELEPTKGDVSIDPKCRMSVLKQDHFAYEEFTVLDTIMQGNQRLYDVMKTSYMQNRTSVRKTVIWQQNWKQNLQK